MSKSIEVYIVPAKRLVQLTLLAACVGVVSPCIAADFEPLSQPSPINSKWNSLVQLDVTRAGTRLVCVGERGFVGLSDDNGTSWRQVKVPVSTTLTHVNFVDAKVGWAVGHSGVVLKTVDGGENWEKQFDGVSAANTELAASKAIENGSETSQKRVKEAQRLVADGPDKPFLSVRFFDVQRGLIVGAYGLAFETVDGGRTWQSLADRMDSGRSRHLYAIDTTGERIFLAGEQGVVLASKDDGKTFASLPFPGKGTVFGLVSSNSTLIAYGLKGAAYRSSDQGENWVSIDLPKSTITTGLRLSNDDMVLGNEAGQLFVSKDGGRTFKQLKIRNPDPVSSLTEAADGAIVRAGVRGVSRVEVDGEESKK
jgi:photosystem II stability/assembly factor-like uncharacterized protein